MSGRVRAPRTCKIRLGYKKKGERGDFPKDSDVFVLRSEDQAKDEVAQLVLKTYGQGKIEEATGEVYSLGKSLRMMLPWDFDLTYEGREVGLELMNRAWSHSKLRCTGTGGDVAGEAVCRDRTMLDELAKATKHKAIVRDDGESWNVTCLGPRCPFWHSNMEKNKAATCHSEMRLWAWLLHPAKDPEDKNFLKKLAAVEIASGSFNGMLDVQSGLKTIHALVGRTALIPFTLRRVPRTVLSDGKRVLKATLLVDFDQDEVIRFGYSDPKLALVRPEVRKQLLAQKEELLRLAAMESSYESFKDIVPRLEAPRSGESGGTDYPLTGSATGSGGGEAASGTSLSAAATDTVPDSSTSVVADRDQVIEEAAEQPPRVSGEELNRLLTQDERNELKVLCGGEAGKPETQGHFRELVTLAFKELEDWNPSWDPTRPPLTLLKVKHALWIREAVEIEKGVVA